MRRILEYLAVALAVIMFAACSSTRPLPQPRRVADPSEVPGAVRAERWEIAAVGYEYPDQGLNYEKAGLNPVFLIFKNKSEVRPVVNVDEARGVAQSGEYLPYTITESERLVFASETFKNTAYKSAKTGALGAVAGAGLGAIIGSIGGGDNIWKGAVIGGAVGGMAGAAAGIPGTEAELKRVIREELNQYAWTSDQLPQDYTKVGYLYFPDEGIEKVKIIVRWQDRSETYTVPVVQPPDK